MQWAAWDARLSKPDGKGIPARAHYEKAARQGNAVARAALVPPCEFPEVLGYLWDDRFKVLEPMRATDMNGPRPLTVSDIRGANELFGWDLTHEEALAIHALDMVTLYPPEEEKEVATQPVPGGDWPSKQRESA